MQVRYTLGEVVASLAMIESPSSTAIIESKPPAYADEPDAPLEKEPLMPAEAAADQDVEITVIDHKPVTANIRSSIGLLHRTGGFFGRWRGFGLGMLYHLLHSLIANGLASLVGFGIVGHALTYTFTSLLTARLHMAWTHAMIASPSPKPWFRRLVPRKQCRAILLPTLAFAAAQQATVILPIAVAFALGLPQQMHNGNMQAHHGSESHGSCAMRALLMMRFLAVPLTAIFTALCVLLPAAVTLTRIEAALLPADQSTIVSFDRTQVLGSLDLQQRGAARAVFLQAWRSFDRAARLRLIKLYAKMALVQITIAVAGLALMGTELAVIGGERLFIAAKSGAAQMQLMAIEAQKQGAN